MDSASNRQIRQWVLNFLYQCEAEKIYFFSTTHLENFIDHQQIPELPATRILKHVKNLFAKKSDIDQIIGYHSKKWTVERMAIMDRNILRLATLELISRSAPTKVIINEAIELAKEFGSEHSGRFANGILDAVAKDLGKKNTSKSAEIIMDGDQSNDSKGNDDPKS